MKLYVSCYGGIVGDKTATTRGQNGDQTTKENVRGKYWTRRVGGNLQTLRNRSDEMCPRTSFESLFCVHVLLFQLENQCCELVGFVCRCLFCRFSLRWGQAKALEILGEIEWARRGQLGDQAGTMAILKEMVGATRGQRGDNENP